MLAALSVTKKQRSGTNSSVARQSRKEGRIVRKIHARVEHRNDGRANEWMDTHPLKFYFHFTNPKRESPAICGEPPFLSTNK